MEITWFCTSQVEQVLKAPREEKHSLSACRFHLGPTMFLVCPAMDSSMQDKEFGSLLLTD
jgi:hypothetical protein